MSDNTNSQNTITATIDASIVTQMPSSMLEHVLDTTNPHQVTCEQIGALPSDTNVIIDDQYNHTDNNYTNEDKDLLYSISEDYAPKASINDLSSNIDDINSNITTYREELDGINENIDNFWQEIDGINGSFGDIHDQLDNHNTSINTINSNITTINKSIGNINQKVGNKADVSYVDDKIDEIINSGSGNNTTNIIKPNLLINPTFSINSRGKTLYSSTLDQYTVDRWIKNKFAVVGFDKSGTTYIKNSSDSELATLTQFIAIDPRNFANRSVAIFVNTDWGEYMFSIPENSIPEDPVNSCPDFVFDSLDTEFGMIEFGFHTNHFYLKIIVWPTELGAETKTILLYNAKVEFNQEYSGFEYPDTLQETLKCLTFYQPIETHSMMLPGYCIRKTTTTTYTTQIITSTPMYKQPTTFVTNNTNNQIQVAEEGESSKTITFTNLTNTIKSKDFRIFNISFNCQEDNSSIPGTEVGIYSWAAIKFSGYAFESEIFD